jgi:hypothetical protein
MSSIFDTIADQFDHATSSIAFQTVSHELSETLSYNEYIRQEEGNPYPQSATLGISWIRQYGGIGRYGSPEGEFIVGKILKSYSYILASKKRNKYTPVKNSYNSETIRLVAENSSYTPSLVTRVLNQLYYYTKDGTVKSSEFIDPVTYQKEKEKKDQHHNFNWKPWAIGGAVILGLGVSGYFINSSSDLIDNFTD